MTNNDDISDKPDVPSPSEDSASDEAVALSTRLEGETGYLGWSDLVRFFARGVVVRIDQSLDLVEVGECMATDDSARLKDWADAGLVARASDDDARRWSAGNPTFRALVTAPWVLVQEKSPVA